jgi:hypothetical protein
MPEFELYRPLFEKELELLEGHGADDWISAYEQIENLKLILFDPHESKPYEFLLHIEGAGARFKLWTAPI